MNRGNRAGSRVRSRGNCEVASGNPDVARGGRFRPRGRGGRGGFGNIAARFDTPRNASAMGPQSNEASGLGITTPILQSTVLPIIDAAINAAVSETASNDKFVEGAVQSNVGSDDVTTETQAGDGSGSLVDDNLINCNDDVTVIIDASAATK